MKSPKNAKSSPFEPHSQVSEVRENSVDRREALRDKLPWPIEMHSPHSLRPAARNARTHSKKQIREIADSMTRFGVISPVVCDEHRTIVAGHARAEAAKLLNLKQIPVIMLSYLSQTEIRAFMLADNKLASKAGWDRELLVIELEELQLKLPEINLDIGITGFDPGEVDSIMLDFKESQGSNPADYVPKVEHDRAVARAGEVFVLGKHRLLVGDARNEAAYVQLMQGETATMAFLDPPYNVRVAGHVGGRGRIKHREFICASGEMTSGQFVQFLRDTLAPCARNVVDGAVVFICMDWRHIGELTTAGAEVFTELKNIVVWVKSTPGQGSFYRSQHELVFVYKSGSGAHINTFELGQNGRCRTNVWRYDGGAGFRAGRMTDLEMHPTVKPVALIADAMRDCSRRGSIVLDAFAGSGSTIIAGEQIGRRAFCLEIDPIYADVAIRRWQKFTGRDVLIESTGQTFDELAAHRMATAADDSNAQVAGKAEGQQTPSGIRQSRKTPR